MTDQTLVFSDDLEADLLAALTELRARRVLVVCAPSRRFLDRVTAALGELCVGVLAEARVHVPADVVEKASEVVRETHPDVVLTLGGGSATGLGKALRLEHEVELVALPTTYAGSERTSIYGIRKGRDKQTGRDPRVRPALVIYEPRHTLDMPPGLTAQSLMNALAHPVSALSTGSLEAAARLRALAAVTRALDALEQLAQTPRSIDARMTALRAASLAGAVLEEGTLGVHHRIAHLVGGRFDLDHAGVHSVLLPHTVAGIAESAPALFAELTDAAGAPDLPAVLFDRLRDAGAPTSLRALGADEARLEQALAEHPELPASWALRAFRGERP